MESEHGCCLDRWFGCWNITQRLVAVGRISLGRRVMNKPRYEKLRVVKVVSKAGWDQLLKNLGKPQSYETLSEGEYLVCFEAEELKVSDACSCQACAAFRRLYPSFLPASKGVKHV